ncbi:hypothetical protein ES702_05567 [subsurface metagenome]
MSKRKNLKPRDIDEEIEKNQAPRDINPPARKLTNPNPGQKRAEKEEKQKRIGPEYPGQKE